MPALANVPLFLLRLVNALITAISTLKAVVTLCRFTSTAFFVVLPFLFNALFVRLTTRLMRSYCVA